MLKAIAEGETDPAALAALADGRLRAKPEQTRDALGGVCAELHPVYRRLIQMALEESPSIDKRMEQLEQQMADLLRQMRAKCSDWRRYPAWDWIRHSKSLQK